MKKITLVYFNILAVLSVICQPIFAQTPQIGDTFQGGIVFYLESGGYSGLIAAPSNFDSGGILNNGKLKWGCKDTLIGGTERDIGAGADNTLAIELGCTTTDIAADACANLTLGGYSDWFLPSRDELWELHQNIGYGNALGLGNIAGMGNGQTWSSTEVSSSTAKSLHYSFGWYNAGKNENFYVRAVRAF